MNGQQLADKLGEKIEWYEAEIERMREIIAEQDRRAKTKTARGEIRMGKGGPVFIVTAGDEATEERLMQLVFAGFATLVWTSLSMSFEAMWPNESIRKIGEVLFDQSDGGKEG
jgi:hypothetical protein